MALVYAVSYLSEDSQKIFNLLHAAFHLPIKAMRRIIFRKKHASAIVRALFSLAILKELL